MNKQEIRSNLDRLLNQKLSTVELSDKKVRDILMYLLKFHNKNIIQVENQIRQQNG